MPNRIFNFWRTACATKPCTTEAKVFQHVYNFLRPLHALLIWTFFLKNSKRRKFFRRAYSWCHRNGRCKFHPVQMCWRRTTEYHMWPRGPRHLRTQWENCSFFHRVQIEAHKEQSLWIRLFQIWQEEPFAIFTGCDYFQIAEPQQMVCNNCKMMLSTWWRDAVVARGKRQLPILTTWSPWLNCNTRFLRTMSFGWLGGRQNFFLPKSLDLVIDSDFSLIWERIKWIFQTMVNGQSKYNHRANKPQIYARQE